ncbi:hypothetical protein [Sulfuricurvum sp.]|uniref:hypothetical protein n=1 Tax=Sulfuricurvum sp. TaxID=2025608 RepID=UPI003562EBC8
MKSTIGKYVDDFPDDESVRKSIVKYDRCVKSREMIEEIAELDLPIGRKQFCSTLIPIKDETGRVCRIIGLAKDIMEAAK